MAIKLFRLAGLVALLGISGLVGATSVPLRNAYCPVPIRSVPQLEKIVQRNPAVRNHYERHFGMSQTELIEYFSTLKVTRASEPEDVMMFSVPKSGIIKSHPYHIARGESVIVDPDGKPIICPECGNPLTLGGNNTPNMALLLPTIVQPTESTLRALVPPTPAEQVSAMISAPTSVIDEPNILADEVQPPETTKDVIAAAIAPAAQPQVQIIAAAAAGGGFPFLPLLGAGGLAALAHGPGGGPPPAVPEPAVLLLFAAAPLLLLRRRI